jgi:RNA polymerase sigma-70 factor (ECF subfamily)
MAAYRTHTDDELVELLKQHDQHAFREIYDRYWEQLFAQAVKKLDNNHEAEDAVQQLFIEVWERRANLRITRSLHHWLAAAIKYKVYSLYSDRYRSMRASAEISTDIPENAPLLHSLIEMQQLIAELETMVEALPERPRIVYRMSREGGLSNKEIAEQLNISEKTVENHMNRALNALRKSLGNSTLSIVLTIF